MSIMGEWREIHKKTKTTNIFTHQKVIKEGDVNKNIVIQIQQIKQQKRLVRFVKLGFGFQDVINVWFAIAACDQANCFEIAIYQSRSMC